MTTTLTCSLADAVAATLAGEAPLDSLTEAVPADRRDRILGLLSLYDIYMGPVDRLGPSARLTTEPAVVELKARLEHDWIDQLDALPAPQGDPVPVMRALAARDRIPPLYRSIAEVASWDQVVQFLSLEGGPDAGFDDLVATCQLGLTGRAKLELAANFWDEMGKGTLGDVHTILYEKMVATIAMPVLDRASQPTEALERTGLGGLLATNRWLQPEMLGALGIIELQAGPRCRMILHAFDRLGAPQDAYPFYAVHAQVDPVHGRTWLDNAIAPVLADTPSWSRRIIRGAWWRSQVNAAFFDSLSSQLAVG